MYTFAFFTSKCSGLECNANDALYFNCFFTSSAASNTAFPTICVAVLATVFQCLGLVCVFISMFTLFLFSLFWRLSAKIFGTTVFVPFPIFTRPIFRFILPSLLNVIIAPAEALVGDIEAFQRHAIPLARMIFWLICVTCPSSH